MIEIEHPSEAFSVSSGPILLLAGPGTGKTYQLTQRVKYLVNELNANPDEIAVITFTIEAARSMREKLTDESLNLPSDKIPEIISTMHSIGNSIIGTAPALFDLPDEYDLQTNQYLKKILFQDAAYLVTGDRGKGFEAELCRGKGEIDENQNNDNYKINLKYEEILRKCGAIDYDDQISLACKALKLLSDLRLEWQAKTKYLLIDEFQDINKSQWELIFLLSENQAEGLFAVGDDDQSIYSFRGGSPKYISDFEDHIGVQVKIGRLSTSWRCPEHILMGAKSMLKTYYGDSVLKPEPIFSEKITHNNLIEMVDLPSDKYEANFIANRAKEQIKGNSIIIIIPNNKYFPLIKKALQRKGLSYQYKTGLDEEGIIRFSVLADWINNPENTLRFRYVLDLIINNHDDLTKTFLDDTNNLRPNRLAASNYIADLWEMVSQKLSLLDIINIKDLDSDDSEYLSKIKNECLKLMTNLLQDKGGKRSSLPTFLEKAGLLVAPGKNPENLIREIRSLRDDILGAIRGTPYFPVKIYNMPSSKGLEGDIIFVVGLADELFPNPDRDIEEQARLFYVAMTRAKKKLILLNARRRDGTITMGGRSFQLKPSEFIGSIDDSHIDFKYIQAKKKK